MENEKYIVCKWKMKNIYVSNANMTSAFSIRLKWLSDCDVKSPWIISCHLITSTVHTGSSEANYCPKTTANILSWNCSCRANCCSIMPAIGSIFCSNICSWSLTFCEGGAGDVAGARAGSETGDEAAAAPVLVVSEIWMIFFFICLMHWDTIKKTEKVKMLSRDVKI